MIEIHSALRKKQLHDVELVLSAAGIQHIRRWEGDAHHLYVSDEDYDRAREELAAFAEENSAPEPSFPAAIRRGSPWPGVIIYGVILLTMYVRQHDPLRDFQWTQEGMASAGLIQDGEWWRSITALTLHVDVKHVIGNVIFGSLFGALLAQVVGNGVGWLTVVASGAVGNYANAWIRGAERSSIGASTAVFGALGALVAWQWVYGRRTAMGRARRWAPVAAGIAMLAYLGGAEPGDNVDVGAHVAGFLAGVVLGLAHMHWTATRNLGAPAQLFLGVCAIASLVAGWGLAGHI